MKYTLKKSIVDAVQFTSEAAANVPPHDSSMHGIVEVSAEDQEAARNAALADPLLGVRARSQGGFEVDCGAGSEPTPITFGSYIVVKSNPAGGVLVSVMGKDEFESKYELTVEPRAAAVVTPAAEQQAVAEAGQPITSEQPTTKTRKGN